MTAARLALLLSDIRGLLRHGWPLDLALDQALRASR